MLKQQKSKIYINEDLTKLNAQRLLQIKQHVGVLSAWSFQGKLYCKLLQIKQHVGVLSAWSFQGKLYGKLLDLRKVAIEEGNVDLIDRLLLESPRPSQLHQPRRPLVPASQPPEHGRLPANREGAGTRRKPKLRPLHSAPAAPHPSPAQDRETASEREQSATAGQSDSSHGATPGAADTIQPTDPHTASPTLHSQSATAGQRDSGHGATPGAADTIQPTDPHTASPTLHSQENLQSSFRDTESDNLFISP
ncbi:hypothetical protein ACOMHN_045905 [Nucella lapillus]